MGSLGWTGGARYMKTGRTTISSLSVLCKELNLPCLPVHTYNTYVVYYQNQIAKVLQYLHRIELFQHAWPGPESMFTTLPWLAFKDGL